ncbi:unannotated protein [freshwater metagenome]|uniref:Unannotated protein n=1 Tax=freshwater metagenome TaxID=449393 RepID=A0A6J6XTK0_9ZZZZ
MTRAVAVAKARRGDGPVDDAVEHVVQLLTDEGINGTGFDVTQVHEQFTQPPPLKLRTLHFKSFPEGLGGQDARGDESHTKKCTAPRNRNGVQATIAKPHGCDIAVRVGDSERSRGFLGRQIQ